MLSKIAFLWLTSLLLTIAQGIRIEESQEFPLGSEVENLALRPSGNVLAVVYTYPRIYELSPTANATPRLIHTFQDTNGVSSITQSPSNPDEYFVVTGNFSFQTFSPTPGSYAIHRLSFENTHNDYPNTYNTHNNASSLPVVEYLAPLPPIAQPNGIVAVPGTTQILIADAREGFVYRFDTATRELGVYFDHPLLKPTRDDVVFGVNGLKIAGGYLYFSNTNQQLVARVPMRVGGASCEEEEGDTLIGEPEIVATGTPVDDFVVDGGNGDVYIAQLETSSLGFVSGEEYGSVPRVLVGGVEDPTVLGSPTAAIWAADAVGKTLLVSVNGDFSQFVTGNYTGGNMVAVVHLE